MTVTHGGVPIGLPSAYTKHYCHDTRGPGGLAAAAAAAPRHARTDGFAADWAEQRPPGRPTAAMKPPRGQPASVSSVIVHYNPRNPNKKRVPPFECISSVAMERPFQHALARLRLLAPREHVAPQAPGGALLLALDKAVHPLAAAEVELPLDTARAGL